MMQFTCDAMFSADVRITATDSAYIAVRNIVCSMLLYCFRRLSKRLNQPASERTRPFGCPGSIVLGVKQFSIGLY